MNVCSLYEEVANQLTSLRLTRAQVRNKFRKMHHNLTTSFFIFHNFSCNRNHKPLLGQDALQYNLTSKSYPYNPLLRKLCHKEKFRLRPGRSIKQYLEY